MRGFVVAAVMAVVAGGFAFIAQLDDPGGGGALSALRPFAIGVATALIILAVGLIRTARRGAAAAEDPHTGAWYWTRLELAIGVFPVAYTGSLILFPPAFLGFHRDPPWMVALPFVGLAGMLVGLAWMLRIARGTGDEPPPWRYRDR
jgi:hypothetical protein